MRARRGIPEGCPLSRRELEAVCAIANGRTYKQIAAANGRSASTIRSQLHDAYRKLGIAGGGAQAAIHCWKRGWILIDGFDAMIAPAPVPPPKVARADRVEPEMKLFTEALVRAIHAGGSDEDHEEARVLLRIVRRKAAERKAAA